ncbi:MAG: TIR domain-containing protein [Bdellovibrionales bacterium]|nr:TIR domain-containing protein [Bdellovibrionales bacterium]
MSSHTQPSPLPVFVCYAHKDNEAPNPTYRWLDRLLEQLAPLAIQNQVTAWSDKDLETGQDWHQRIQQTLKTTKAAVLLVSPSFLASKYIRNSELPVLLKNAKEKGVIILPVILRHCLFKETTFKYPDPVHGPEYLSLSALPTANPPSTPLNSLSEHEQDKVLLEVAQRLFTILQTSTQEASFSPTHKKAETASSTETQVMRQATPSGQPAEFPTPLTTPPRQPTPSPAAFSGPTKLAFCKHLGDDWSDLADMLEIDPATQRRFAKGEEGRAIWHWLHDRQQLHRLPAACHAIHRPELADLFTSSS